MVWSRTYVCCAVPLYNAGIYTILAQFVVVALVTGILSFASPSIVAVSIPSFGPYILGIVCLIVVGVQVLGFLGVYREKPNLFKTYARLNAVATAIALLVALAFIALSAARHSTAVTKCQATFASSSSVTSGKEICDIWTWVQVGIMGLLFIIIGLCETYFLMYENIYASEQKLDHQRYNSVYSNAAEEIRQSGLWDGSAGPLGAPGYSHARNESKASGLRNEIRPEEEEDHSGAGYYDGPPQASYSGVPYETAHEQEPYYEGGRPNNAYAQPQQGYGHGQPSYQDQKQSYPDQQYAHQGQPQYYEEPQYAHDPRQGSSSAPHIASPTSTVGNLNWDPAQYQSQSKR